MAGYIIITKNGNLRDLSGKEVVLATRFEAETLAHNLSQCYGEPVWFHYCD